MNITENKIGQNTLVAIEGRFDGITSIDIQKKLLSILQDEKTSLIVDFNGVTYLSSAGMRTLLLVAKRAKELDVSFCIIRLSSQIREILEMTGFLSFLRTYKDIDEATAEINKA